MREQNLAAVLRPGTVDVIAGDHAAGARHVLDDDRWIARNVPAQMLGNRAAIEVIAAAGTCTHQNRNGSALVESSAVLSRRRDAGNRGSRQNNCCAYCCAP